MTSAELKSYLDLTEAIEHHKQALDTAVKEKQQLAHTLYVRYGGHAVYRITKGAETQDLMIARTKVATYYFARRVRYPKGSRLAKTEQRRLDRAARLKTFPTQASVVRPLQLDSAKPTVAEMELAEERGRHDRDRATAKLAAKLAPFTPQTAVGHEELSKRRLPIVGDVEQPRAPVEPRLLEIQEPSGALLGDAISSRSEVTG